MLNEIKNRSGNADIALLNSKIHEYNQALKGTSRTIQLFFLQEINQINMAIKRLMIDDPDHMNQYLDILEFKGIGDELKRFKLPRADGPMADNILTRELSNQLGLPTDKKWQKTISGSWINSCFYTPSEEMAGITKNLQRLNQAKAIQLSKPSFENIKSYLNALQSIKQTLLDNLSYAMTEPSEIKHTRSLLLQINGEIIKTQALLPDVKNRELFADKVVASDIYQELSLLPTTEMNQLITMLRHPNAINPAPPSKNDITALLPSLREFNLQKLGGFNNINWKISNPEKGLELVIQLGEPGENQAIRHRLEHSRVSEYFTTPFFSSPLNAEMPYSLTLTELCTGGDLRAERENKFSQVPMDDLLKAATSRINQISSICQLCVQQQVVHPDIKLTNFLTDSQGKIVIADKKTFIGINKDGTMPKDAMISPLNEPPEARNKRSNIDPEAFMTFQLGLAYYDYLRLPEVSDDWNKPLWSQQLPLDVSHPMFSSEIGEKVKSVILKMTDPDPTQRPCLNEVKLQLAQISPNYFSNQTENQQTLTSKNSMAFKEKLTALKGESLTSDILAHLKQRIEETSSLDELNQLKADYINSDEYKHLSQSENIIVNYTPGFFSDTANITAVKQMFLTQETKLSASASTQLPGH